MPPLLPLIKKSGFDEYANLETPQPYTFPAPSLVNGAYRNIAISYILHLHDTDTALSVFGWQSNITVCEDTNDFRKGQSVFSGAGQSQTIIIRSSFFHYWFQFTFLHRRTPERMKEKKCDKGGLKHNVWNKCQSKSVFRFPHDWLCLAKEPKTMSSFCTSSEY